MNRATKMLCHAGSRLVAAPGRQVEVAGRNGLTERDAELMSVFISPLNYY